MNCIHGKEEQEHCSKCRNEERIYIIQEIISGVAECPTVLLDEKEADKFYLNLVYKVYGRKFKKTNKAAKFVRKEDEAGNDHLILYWVTPPL